MVVDFHQTTPIMVYLFSPTILTILTNTCKSPINAQEPVLPSTYSTSILLTSLYNPTLLDTSFCKTKAIWWYVVSNTFAIYTANTTGIDNRIFSAFKLRFHLQIRQRQRKNSCCNSCQTECWNVSCKGWNLIDLLNLEAMNNRMCTLSLSAEKCDGNHPTILM